MMKMFGFASSPLYMSVHFLQAALFPKLIEMVDKHAFGFVSILDEIVIQSVEEADFIPLWQFEHLQQLCDVVIGANI